MRQLGELVPPLGVDARAEVERRADPARGGPQPLDRARGAARDEMAERRAQSEAGDREAGEDQRQTIQGRIELVQRPGKLHGEPRAGRTGEDPQVLAVDLCVDEECRLPAGGDRPLPLADRKGDLAAATERARHAGRDHLGEDLGAAERLVAQRVVDRAETRLGSSIGRLRHEPVELESLETILQRAVDLVSQSPAHAEVETDRGGSHCERDGRADEDREPALQRHGSRRA